jgi:hypothetical protein
VRGGGGEQMECRGGSSVEMGLGDGDEIPPGVGTGGREGQARWRARDLLHEAGVDRAGGGWGGRRVEVGISTGMDLGSGRWGGFGIDERWGRARNRGGGCADVGMGS